MSDIELVRDLRALKPGSDAALGCYRKGKEMIIHVTVGDRSKIYAEIAAQ